MEKKTERKLKDDGTYVDITRVSTTPEDGFTDNLNRVTIDDPTHVKGYQTNIRFETDDPRIVKPFLYGLCSIFYIISIILLIVKCYFFSILFFIVTTVTLILQLKTIKEKEKELLNNPTYNPNDKEVIKDFCQTVKTEVKDVNEKTFTKKNFKWFVKSSIPICTIIAFIISIVFGIIIGSIYSILYGILTFFGSLIILALLFIIYFALVSKLFKH